MLQKNSWLSLFLPLLEVNSLSQRNGSLYGVHMVTAGRAEEERGGKWEMTHVLMKTHNDSSTPVLILQEIKPNAIHLFSCTRQRKIMNISSYSLCFCLRTVGYIWILQYIYVCVRCCMCHRFTDWHIWSKYAVCFSIIQWWKLFRISKEMSYLARNMTDMIIWLIMRYFWKSYVKKDNISNTTGWQIDGIPQ